MAESDAFKRYLDAGMAFTQLTRSRAEQIVKDLVAAGELQQKQARAAIDDLVERSRKNAESVGEIVRKEVSSQLAALGLATQADIARLEAKIAASGPASTGGGAPPAEKPAPPAKKAAPATKAPPAQKAAPAAKASPAKKATKKS